MKLEKFPPRNSDPQKKEIENLKNIQKERFKSKDVRRPISTRSY